MSELQKVNLGTPPTAVDGDTVRVANARANANVDVLNAQATLSSAPDTITAPQALTAAHIGKRVSIDLAEAGVVNMPPANVAVADAVVLLRNVGSVVVSLAVAAGSGDTAGLSALNPGESALIDTDGSHAWSVVMRSYAPSHDLSVPGTFNVKGVSSFGSDGQASISEAGAYSGPSAHYSGDVAVDGTLSVGDTLSVDGTLSVGGTLSVTEDVNVSGSATLSGGANAGGKVIANLANPVDAKDAANKQYVDSGLNTKLNNPLGNNTTFILSNGITNRALTNVFQSVVQPGGLVPGYEYHHPNVTAMMTYLLSNGVFVWANTNGGASVSTVRGSMDISGNMTINGTYAAASDVRIKTNITLIPDAGVKIDALRGVTFNRVDLDDNNRVYAGLIAQDLDAVFAPAVTREASNGSDNTGEDAILHIDPMGPIALLVEEVKALRVRVASLERGAR